MKVAVIGGGPSGLVVLKYLISVHYFQEVDPIEVQLFEAEDRVGGTFTYRTYENAELVSSAGLTSFSDFRSPNPNDYLSAVSYIKYLEDYCTSFGLWPYIKLSTRVTRVQRREKGGHTITFATRSNEPSEWDCDAVAVCSGLHVRPNIPNIRGVENLPVVFHSSEFKNRKQLGTGNVLVMGTGETGMDIAYLSVTSNSTKSTTISHRDGFVVAPKRTPDLEIFGRRVATGGSGHPIDLSTPTSFSTAYIHPRLRGTLWKKMEEYAVRSLCWFSTGTSLGYDQWVGTLPKAQFKRFNFFYTKSSKAMPYISANYRSTTLLDRIRSSIIRAPPVDTGGKTIDLAPWPEYVDTNGTMHFKKTSRPESQKMEKIVYKPDVVVLATGYIQEFPFLDRSYPTPEMADVRGIWKTGEETVGFIGFLRPTFGAIPPLAELQAQLWVLSLINKIRGPLGPEYSSRHYNNPSCRIQYGVDHDAYAYQLATDIGGVPSLLQAVAKGWKVWAVWALGGSLNTKFRIVGPWQWGGADEVIRTELYDSISRRRSLFDRTVGLVILLLIMGTSSLMLYAFDGVVGLEFSIWNLATLLIYR